MMSTIYVLFFHWLLYQLALLYTLIVLPKFSLSFPPIIFVLIQRLLVLGTSTFIVIKIGFLEAIGFIVMVIVLRVGRKLLALIPISIMFFSVLLFDWLPKSMQRFLKHSYILRPTMFVFPLIVTTIHYLSVIFFLETLVSVS